MNNNIHSFEHLYDPVQVNEDYYDVGTVSSLNETIAEYNNSL